jgi:hypothetical protein
MPPKRRRERKDLIMGLIGGIARTAVVAGTATAVSNRVSRRQYNRWAQQGDPYATEPAGYSQPPQQYAPQQYAPQQYAQPAPPAPSQSGPDRIEQLKSLADLKAQGILTDEEFAAEKARILRSYS